MLATWGPQPFAREEVASAFAEADRFYRKASFDQLSLRGDVTPWLTGYATRPECPRPPFEPGRVPAALTNGPDAAAAAAGYRVESYDRVIYVIPRIACTWAGIAAGRQVVLNDSSAWRDFVHELGHTDGLAHAKAQLCRGCQIEEYGDPFSPMGHGLVDFSAYEKLQMGWIRDVARISRAGSYRIGRPDVLGATPYALVVRTAAGEYWFEQRLDIPTHGLVVRKILPDEPNELEARRPSCCLPRVRQLVAVRRFVLRAFSRRGTARRFALRGSTARVRPRRTYPWAPAAFCGQRGTKAAASRHAPSRWTGVHSLAARRREVRPCLP